MQYWGLTDPGCVREQNQDTYLVKRLDRNSLLCVVCDGMGGARSGNVASSLASEVFTQEVESNYHPAMDPETLDQTLTRAAKLANFTVYDQARQFPEFEGMGTTLVAALIRGRQAVVLNVGDSRAYWVNPEDIRQITRDHSLVQLMVQRGELPPRLAKEYPGKNYITRAVGTEPQVRSDLFHVDLERGDSLLLCTDGLTNILDDQEILFEVVHGISKKNCCQRLLDIAKKRGAPDNVTSVLVQI